MASPLRRRLHAVNEFLLSDVEYNSTFSANGAGPLVQALVLPGPSTRPTFVCCMLFSPQPFRGRQGLLGMASQTLAYFLRSRVVRRSLTLTPFPSLNGQTVHGHASRK
ncbi:MAG: hypothetical protein FD138_3060 [Planctomycetota bacterium]|nr:MAG: hypothetical protein FD138_3060 [Planctomycetota bacterium]